MVKPVDHLAAAMEERRLELDLEWRDIAKRGNLSYETVRALRSSGRASKLSKRRVENALEWEPGSIDAVLAGGTATPTTPARPAASPLAAEDLKRLIAETEDELLHLNPRYESNRALLTEHLERRLVGLRQQLEALRSQ